MRTTHRYSEFGAVVRELMDSRGIAKQSELAEMLSEVSDETYTQQRLSRYMIGDRPVYKRMPKHLYEALDLNEQEWKKLAYYFTFGQEAAEGSLKKVS